MAKTKTVYVCSNCGADSPKWLGKCPNCGEWNTYVEEIVSKDPPAKSRASAGLSASGEKVRPVRLRDITAQEEDRLDLHDAELNRVLGGGVVRGSLVLIGGDPGIGKSTLVLQTVLKLPDLRVLYVSGEESSRQLKLRADRLGSTTTDSLYILCETNLENIFEHARAVQPDLMIIDSIQTIFTELVESSPGSVSQVRECSAAILRFAKENGVPVLLIGHINKEGSIAGPKVLEHIVDTVLQFEGDQHYMYRILRSIKNRFGSTSERREGLREVSNPSELLLTQNHEGLSGVAIAAAIEGVRPFLIETQGLVSSAVYGTPQRSATGFDLRRMNMLLAVLEKRAGFKLIQKDVFLNTRHRPCRPRRHPLVEPRHHHRAGHVHGRRSGPQRGNPPGEPHRAAHPRGRKAGLHPYPRAAQQPPRLRHLEMQHSNRASPEGGRGVPAVVWVERYV